MEIKTVWAVYFSGTGTTQKVVTTLAKTAAQALDCPYQEFCFNDPALREQQLAFAQGDLVVVGVPVYAGRVPNLLLPYLQGNVHGNGALAVPVVLYGNRNFDDGLMELRNVLLGNGFHPITAAAIVGEHSFSRILGAGRPDGADMALVDALTQKTVELVHTLAQAPEQPVQVEGCDPIRPYYTPRDRHGAPIVDFIKAKPKTHLDKCTQCGLCAQLCPMGSILAEDVSNVAGKCIKCCACVKKCPTQAKYFDHEGYVYHQHELEELYGPNRAESKLFV